MLNEIRKQKNNLYTELLIAIKEETISDSNSKNNQNNNEITLEHAIKNIFQNLEKNITINKK